MNDIIWTLRYQGGDILAKSEVLQVCINQAVIHGLTNYHFTYHTVLEARDETELFTILMRLGYSFV